MLPAQLDLRIMVRAMEQMKLLEQWHHGLRGRAQVARAGGGKIRTRRPLVDHRRIGRQHHRRGQSLHRREFSPFPWLEDRRRSSESDCGRAFGLAGLAETAVTNSTLRSSQ